MGTKKYLFSNILVKIFLDLTLWRQYLSCGGRGFSYHRVYAVRENTKDMENIENMEKSGGNEKSFRSWKFIFSQSEMLKVVFTRENLNSKFSS